MKRSFVVLAVACLALTACGGASGRLAVQEAWARPTAAGNNGAVYMLVSNGGSDDVLLGASAEIARAVEIHETMAVDESTDEDDDSMDHSDMDLGGDDEALDMDAMQMMPVDSLAIASGEEVAFAPGGYHVMLVDLQVDLIEGESFVVTLHFEQAGDVEVDVLVEQR